MQKPGALYRMYTIGIIAFILFLSTLIALPVLPKLSKELGANPAQIPMVVSASLVTVVLLQFFSGFLSDRFSRRRLLLAGSMAGSVSSLLCIFAIHWTQLFALRIAGGIADAITMPALLSITSVLGKEQPGRFFGILRGSQGLSYAAGPLTGSLLSLYSLRFPFLTDGLLSLLAFVVIFMLYKDDEKIINKKELNILNGIKLTFQNRKIYLYLLLGISGMFSFGILFSFVPAKAELLNLDSWKIGLIIGGGAVLYSIISYGIGILSDKYGKYPFVVAALIIIIVSGICLACSQSFYSLCLSYYLFCIGETIAFLLSFIYASAIFKKEYAGTSMGIFDSAMDLSIFFGPVIAISLYKATGNLNTAFLLAVIPAAIALIAGGILLPKK